MTPALPTALDADLEVLKTLRGDTRMRFHHRQTAIRSRDALIDLEPEIRDALLRPPSPELQAEVTRLIARLRALDPR